MHFLNFNTEEQNLTSFLSPIFLLVMNSLAHGCLMKSNNHPQFCLWKSQPMQMHPSFWLQLATKSSISRRSTFQAMASGYHAKDAWGVQDAPPKPWWITGNHRWNFYFSLCHVVKSSSTLKCTVLANCFCQRLNTFYSCTTKTSLCSSAKKCLGILLGFLYISLDVVRAVFSCIKDSYRIYH